MSDCLFCKIVEGKIPARCVYNDDTVMAFLDIQPVSRGHLLIIPKRHSADLLDMNAEDLQCVFVAVQSIGRAVELTTGADGFNLIVNKGEAAGQVIFHTHIHIIPRFIGDGLRHWPKIEIEDEQLDELAIRIKDSLK
ncbi:hypothetical protein A2480_01400 [Candidatus Uhrbacteria bacterium RIFOXYC2_FULL_47_19]|uniref:HIT domain-containing protein n=1 Tax=Candidatus Uhrbacteria bacterium RIFOXYC2_FULL_47_19 TaxID=1802424 RepID=A0A1F7WEM4_9BACT|nr:MAG: hypothetical protein A2480_01400 [Candidatus Uhrbacteria bacterium RIFOXYC2_FULL_47_19]